MYSVDHNDFFAKVKCKNKYKSLVDKTSLVKMGV